MDSQDYIYNILAFIFVLYVIYTLCLAIKYKNKITKDVFYDQKCLIVSVIISLGIVLVYRRSNEKFRFELGLDKKCIGGDYFWPPDSECGKYLATKEGREAVSKMECEGPRGLYNGQRVVRFTFTPDSNGQWQNERNNVDENKENNEGIY